MLSFAITVPAPQKNGRRGFFWNSVAKRKSEAKNTEQQTTKEKENGKRSKEKRNATRRIYELDSCAPVSRPTMNDSVLSLPNAQALCTPHHGNCGASPASCTPMMKLPTVSGFADFLCTPLTKIAGRLRLCAPP